VTGLKPQGISERTSRLANGSNRYLKD